jgi:predicted dehydrogenase
MTAGHSLTATVLGGGFIGAVHVEALRRIGVDVVGIYDRDLNPGQARAAEFGPPKVYRGFEELINDPSVNVVHITTPSYLHFPQAKSALQSGKHVICEKPLALEASSQLNCWNWLRQPA